MTDKESQKQTRIVEFDEDDRTIKFYEGDNKSDKDSSKSREGYLNATFNTSTQMKISEASFFPEFDKGVEMRASTQLGQS